MQPSANDKKRVVLALGGNALGYTPEKQRAAVVFAAKAAADLLEAGYELVIGHGNGPQVGLIHQGINAFSEHAKEPFRMPFPECTAMSQGYIGFHLQNALQEELRRRGLSYPVASVVTQVAVSPEDPAFQRPNKPIGNFLTKEEAEALEKETGWTFMEDAGRGYRRVVPSPMPVEIVELESVKRMIDAGITVITVGGGGIPVVRTEGGFEGIDAVIDKDRASEKLAEDLDADILLILTAVDEVALRFGKPDEEKLAEVSVEDAKRYLAEGHFAPGSMLPKMEASIRFADSKPGRMAVITSLEKAGAALEGKAGTRIVRK